MGGVFLQQVRLTKESNSFVDSLHAILNATGRFEGPKYLLSGLTGMAFKFVIHKRLLPSSIDMLSWTTETWHAIDRLGIHQDSQAGFTSNPTFPLYQKQAIRNIKDSLDRGVAVLSRGAQVREFAVIVGYDDEDQVLFCKDRQHEEEQIILYQNFGKLQTACWYYNIIGEKIEIDIRDMLVESLVFAVDEWEKEYQLDPQTNREYASGRKAYDYLLHALKSDDYHSYGAVHTLNTYTISKSEIYQYLLSMKQEMPQVTAALQHYERLNDIYQSLKPLLPYHAQRLESRLDPGHIPKLLDVFRQAQEVEEAAVEQLKRLCAEVLENRFINYYRVQEQ